MSTQNMALALKQVLDMIVSLIALMLLSPLMCLIALAINLDSLGPVFFRQERLGHQGKVFWILKFRSMVVGAPDGAVEDGHKDPRITRIGAFIREWSLDEIPQLFNVLKGDMSLVGPRPDRVFRLPEYTDRQRQRLSMKPGITGLQQASGRNTLPFEQRYELDIIYIENWSLWSDAKILFKTIGVVLGRRGIDFLSD
jgi:lipopolysaccharide/colanic/teichoic acid biosynthesis glycosyltransferase